MIALYTVMEGVIAFFLIAGSIFALIGSLGLSRMKDFYMRLHGPSKISTLGVGCVLLASIAYFSLLDGGPSLQELLITIFLFITAPVSAHMLSKSALHQKLAYDPRTRGDPEELQEDDDERTLEETPQGSSKLP
ncbi:MULTISPECIES: Na+/H+ antiporter subunit G [Chromohalobacter]|uniref:Multisubunit potassium/proton antiporter, PhaG subunit n=1 Tax=Chromohalobacter canadensis TaxID=141389 RepID=A0A285VLC8_9GAMM|nr:MULTISPECIES: Na+/H+ antiporter subunit G [Chromohalobacter]MCK0768407.1 Na+/H+ antiporter subunit G [Chromohalobacter canadensis]MCK2044388.1 Na+/H+ antiporter subunit G [Chromohalobacter moromii]MCT8467369.1 Na+/H+ antiporter subunit G [Chromohalobacter canadensis]MCT8470883.1 Na+/H+ antiporter subunit G [Chromohalobacter canadensis]MCT8497866.1 Na+/H+ antiporter subunit G [Chromohalobacter canadensis]